MSSVLVSTWRCYLCDAGGTGGMKEMDRAAEKHTKTEQHATSCETRLVET